MDGQQCVARDSCGSGSARWSGTGDYDVEARAGRELSYQELAPLLRTLLTDRFNMRSHVERRVRPMYELRVLRSDGILGPQMKPSTDESCAAPAGPCSTRGGELDRVEWHLDGRIRDILPGPIGRPVLEKTGLPGRYALRLEYSRTPSADLPSLPTALREQLGLTLEPIEVPAEVIVIDHIEKPTPN